LLVPDFVDRFVPVAPGPEVLERGGSAAGRCRSRRCWSS